MSKSPEKIKVNCPQCDKAILAPTKMAGKSGKCPGCGHRVTIPRLTSTAKNFADLNPPAKNPRALDTVSPPLAPPSADELSPPPKIPTAQIVASVNTPAATEPTTEPRPEPTQEIEQASIEAQATKPEPAQMAGTAESAAFGPKSDESFLGKNWPSLVFWMPCALLCLMVMLYGAVTVIAYSSGPSNMGAFLAKRMFHGLCLILAGLAAYGISMTCLIQYCKRKSLLAKIALYAGSLLCMLGAGFALLVFNQAWHTAWLVVLNLDLTWITWIFAWPLVLLTLGLIIFHAIKTKGASKTEIPAAIVDQINTSGVQNNAGKRIYWAAAAPLALIIGLTFLGMMFPPRKKPARQQIAVPSGIAGTSNNSERIEGTVERPPVTPALRPPSKHTDTYQPKRVRIKYEGDRPKITRFEEVAWILSENHTAQNPDMAQTAAREWLTNNELNAEQQASLISLVTPFLSLTEPIDTNRRLLAFYNIERYGGPEHMELLVETLGSDTQFIESRRLLVFVAKHCKGTKSEIVIDYLMNTFQGNHSSIHFISPTSDEDPMKIVEDALVSIGDPVLKRHGAAIRSNDAPKFQRLARRLNKLSSHDLALQCISEIGLGEQRHAVSFDTLRGLELPTADHDKIVFAIIAKLDSYFQKGELKNSIDQDAMISLSAALTKWGTAKQTLPIITRSIKHAKSRNNYHQLQQQFTDILDFASQSDTPAGAELLVALLQNLPNGMDRARVFQAINNLGEDSKGPLLALLNSNSPEVRKLAEGKEADQASIIKQCFADISKNQSGNRYKGIERLKSMEIEPKNQAFVARQILKCDILYDLKEIYFQCAGKEELNNLKEMAYSKIHGNRYPALKRLLEVDFEEGANRMMEIYQQDQNGLPNREIKRFKDSSFEPALLRIVEDSSLKPNRYLFEVFEEAGTAKSIPALKSFIKRINSIKPKDKKERIRNGYLVEAAQSAIKAIKARK